MGQAATLGRSPRAARPRVCPPTGPTVRSGFVCLCEDVAAGPRASRGTRASARPSCSSATRRSRWAPARARCATATCARSSSARTGDGARRARRRRPGRPRARSGSRRPPPASAIARRAANGAARRHLELGATMEWAGAWKRPETLRRPDGRVLGGARARQRHGRRHARQVPRRRARRRRVPRAPLPVPRCATSSRGACATRCCSTRRGYVIDDGTDLRARRRRATTSPSPRAAPSRPRRGCATGPTTWGLEVHIVNQTAALGAINVAGPRARELLATPVRGPLDERGFPYLRHREITVAGVPCLAIRLGFVGELGYELHHPRSDSVRALGRPARGGRRPRHPPARPRGAAAAAAREGPHHRRPGHRLRLDAGEARHGLGGQARQARLRRQARRLERISTLPLAPASSSAVRFDGRRPARGDAAGRRRGTSATSRRRGFSPVLGHGVGLGWVRRSTGAFPERRRSRTARVGDVVSAPFYDPEGSDSVLELFARGRRSSAASPGREALDALHRSRRGRRAASRRRAAARGAARRRCGAGVARRRRALIPDALVVDAERRLDDLDARRGGRRRGVRAPLGDPAADRAAGVRRRAPIGEVVRAPRPIVASTIRDPCSRLRRLASATTSASARSPAASNVRVTER